MGTPETQLTDALRKAIEDDPRSYGQLGRDSGVSFTVISRFVRRKRHIRTDTAARLAAALGLKLRKGH